MPGALALAAVLVVVGAPAAAAAAAQSSSSGELVVRFKRTATPAERATALALAGLRTRTASGPGGAVVARVRPGTDPRDAAAQLRGRSVVAWAAPALRARIAAFTPNDPGSTATATAATTGGWFRRQWDFTGPFGIRAPEAWDAARASVVVGGREGGRGVVVAVLDTGVAYADRGPYRRSPDLPAVRMIRGRDFVGADNFPNDANGHGTFIAGVIAAAANNGYGMVGVAYASKILAVRVLDEAGEGTSYRVAQGIRYAVDRGARVLNVSIELSDGVQPVSLTSAPDIRAALRYARDRRVHVVAASGNSSVTNVPAKLHSSLTIQVGGTTERGCAAGYSNSGPGLDLVAPGGGADSVLAGGPNCRPDDPEGRSIRQVTFRKASPGRFFVPDDFAGTSMAAPHVTGTVALLLAARTLGVTPSPDAVSRRLKGTALDLGRVGADRLYGAGLLDSAAALGVPRDSSP